jgi:tetratricopeptide (TPR) repeat protein
MEIVGKKQRLEIWPGRHQNVVSWPPNVATALRVFMRSRLVVPLLLAAAALFAAPVLASFSGSKPEPPIQGSQLPEEQADQLTARQQAERLYGDAYDEVAKAKQDLASEKKKKNAERRFKRALERGQQAVELDSTYYEAWNLVGFSARHLGNYDRSIAAYQRCLRIKPDYAAAREYLGEAYVELGKLENAREQLAWLERLKAADEAASLKAQIDAWSAAHPDSLAAPATAAAADSSTVPAKDASAPQAPH